MFLKGDRVVITDDVVNDRLMKCFSDVECFIGLTATVIASADNNDKFYDQGELAIRTDPDDRYVYGASILIHSTSVAHYREDTMLKPVDDESVNALFL